MNIWSRTVWQLAQMYVVNNSVKYICRWSCILVSRRCRKHRCACGGGGPLHDHHFSPLSLRSIVFASKAPKQIFETIIYHWIIIMIIIIMIMIIMILIMIMIAIIMIIIMIIMMIMIIIIIIIMIMIIIIIIIIIMIMIMIIAIMIIIIIIIMIIIIMK